MVPNCTKDTLKGLKAFLPSSPHFSQSVVSFGVSNDGLDSHDGFVDFGLQLPELLDVQQAQNLGSLVDNSIWGRENREELELSIILSIIFSSQEGFKEVLMLSTLSLVVVCRLEIGNNFPCCWRGMGWPPNLPLLPAAQGIRKSGNHSLEGPSGSSHSSLPLQDWCELSQAVI